MFLDAPPFIFNKYHSLCNSKLSANGNTKMHALKVKGIFSEKKNRICVCTMVKQLLPGNKTANTCKLNHFMGGGSSE
jgi:hypothetical protein